MPFEQLEHRRARIETDAVQAGSDPRRPVNAAQLMDIVNKRSRLGV